MSIETSRRLGAASWLAIAAAASVLGAGCGSSTKTLANTFGDDAGDDSGLLGDGATTDDSGTTGDDTTSASTLTIDPSNSTVFIDTGPTPPVAGTQTYKLTLGGVDVSSTGTFTLADPTLGVFKGAKFTSGLTLPGTALGVTTTVHASASGQNVDAKLTIVKIRKTPDPSGHKDFFFTVPYLGTPDPPSDVLLFSTKIQKVDVAFVQDTTGSMSGETNNLKTNLSGTIIPALAKAIPSVGIAIVSHDDYPTGGHGNGGCGDGDLPVIIRQAITTDMPTAIAGVGKLAVHCGGDTPESQIPAMYYVLTGNALDWPGGSVPAHVPAAPHWGGVDFRPGAVPVVVEITDANFHNGISTTPGPVAYSDIPTAPTMAQLQDAFNKAHAKFVGILINPGWDDPTIDGNALSDATNSHVPPGAFGGACGAGQCCTGLSGAAQPPTGPGGTCRLNFAADTSGNGVSTGIVAAIQAISVGSTYDITYKLTNDPKNVDASGKAVDATQFITQLRAMGEGSAANGCDPTKYKYTTKKTNPVNAKDDTFVAVTVGTPVCFEVLPKENTSVQGAASAQFFNAFINMVGEPGAVDLGDQRTVVFLVPPKGPGVR